MPLNLQQKFLLWFSDFRSLRDENTRQGDDILRLRAQLEEERARFDALTERYVGREERLNDRLLDTRFGVKRTEQPGEPRKTTPAESLNPRQWVRQQESKFLEDLKARSAQLDGPGQNSPRTN